MPACQRFALKAIDTLTCVDGVATATISAGHAYRPEQVVEIAGADQPAYNGQFRVIATTATTFTLRGDRHARVARDQRDQPVGWQGRATGWEKAFAGTNKGGVPQQEPASPQTCC